MKLVLLSEALWGSLRNVSSCNLCVCLCVSMCLRISLPPSLPPPLPLSLYVCQCVKEMCRHATSRVFVNVSVCVCVCLPVSVYVSTKGVSM